jgi:potassium-transporting ATPase KdpC subunit
MRAFLRQLVPAFLMLAVFTVITGVVYPLVVTAVGQTAFKDKANGSLLTVNGQVVGSSLIGQNFAEAKYFHPRPSAAGKGYDGYASSGSNLGPTNDALIDAVKQRVIDYRKENGLPDTELVPVDAVTSSASGLDPQISVANAYLQAQRVATARNLPLDTVKKLITSNTIGRALGILNEPGVNVLTLNVALDQAQ